MKKKKGTLYSSTAWPYPARIHSMAEAKEDIQKLQKRFKGFKQQKNRRMQVVIKRIAICSANRAKGMLNSKQVKPATKERLKEVSKLYEKAYQDMKLEGS
jgi:hypothetical protein